MENSRSLGQILWKQGGYVRTDSRGNYMIGSNDSSVESIEKDLFEIKQYVNGLSQFIGKCITPMTISIQGDWGSGKTSIMNMVKEGLGANVIPIWFNTWQYSQFNLGEDLTFSLLGRLIKGLESEQTESAKVYDTFKKTYKAIKKVGRIAVSQVAGKEAVEVLDALADSFLEGKEDASNAVESLKSTFQACVDNAISQKGKDRVVIFIDDLDRLNPAKAVELLEVLKVFLDCEHCVFVLAIDYSVVSSGVKEKYGDLIGSDKGRRFFDKIIQVPFKMPVAHYQVQKFVTEMLKQADPSFDEKDTDIYVDLIQHSVGCNPRTMKRLFNAYMLLMCIGDHVNITARLEDKKDGPWYRKLLFATLCCQHSYEDLYNFIVWNKSDMLRSGILEELQNPQAYRPAMNEEIHQTGDQEENEQEEQGEQEEQDEQDEQDKILAELQEKFKAVPEDLISRMAEYMELFIKIIDRSGDKVLDEKEIEALEEIFSISAISMVGDGEGDVQTNAWGSKILTNVEDLDMGSLPDEKKSELVAYFELLGSNVKVQLLQGKTGHIAVRTGKGKGKIFADVYEAKGGYRVCVYVPEASLYLYKRKMPEIKTWLEEHEKIVQKSASNKKKVSVKVRNKEGSSSLDMSMQRGESTGNNRVNQIRRLHRIKSI